jgi:hypothetical protein
MQQKSVAMAETCHVLRIKLTIIFCCISDGNIYIVWNDILVQQDA